MGTALYQAAALTFEELGFLFSTSEITSEQASAASDGAVEVAFHGPFSGRIVLRVCGDILPMIAANMLGEEDASVEIQRDALGELANVVCGNALPMIAGHAEVFRLSAPQPVPEPVNLAAAAAQTQVGLEQGRADVALFIQESA
jgi:CheY-specific phosphatase CheX